jgi:hypothetical protein
VHSYFGSFAKSCSFLGSFLGATVFVQGANAIPNNNPAATPANMPKNNFPVLMILFLGVKTPLKNETDLFEVNEGLKVWLQR